MLVCMLLFFVSVMPARDSVHNLMPFDAVTVPHFIQHTAPCTLPR
jgi:hypothetical protein